MICLFQYTAYLGKFSSTLKLRNDSLNLFRGKIFLSIINVNLKCILFRRLKNGFLYFSYEETSCLLKETKKKWEKLVLFRMIKNMEIKIVPLSRFTLSNRKKKPIQLRIVDNYSDWRWKTYPKKGRNYSRIFVFIE